MADPVLVCCNGATASPAGGERIISLDWREASGLVNMDPGTLDLYLGTRLPARLRDLVEIAAYVYAADAMVLRGGDAASGVGKDWRRTLRFVIAVRDVDFWTRPDIAPMLEECLAFLSDDRAAFTFVGGVSLSEGKRASGLEFGPGNTPQSVMLFSGGLDSLSGALTHLAEMRTVLLVSHVSSPLTASAQTDLVKALTAAHGKARVIHAPFRMNLRTGATIEDSHRARSFLFAALGGAIATLAQLTRVHFFENGVVSLNLPLAGAIVGARATRTTHPQSLEHFGRLLSAVTERAFDVVNPIFWKTKTDVVEDIRSLGFANLIGEARSCARVRGARKDRPHCGACSQCIDRRFAILAAGLEDADPGAAYRTDLLYGRRPAGADRAIAVGYVESALKMAGSTADTFWGQYPEGLRALASLGYPVDEAARRVFDLHHRHGQAVARVLNDAVGRHSDDLLHGRLEPDCLLQLALPKGERDLAPVASDAPVQAPALPEKVSLAIVGASTARPVVRIEGIGEIPGKGARLMALLATSFREDLAAGLRPENFRGVTSGDLEAALGHSNNEALRKLVARVRRTIGDMAAETGRNVAHEAIIESIPGGYRLNPDTVSLLDPAEIQKG